MAKLLEQMREDLRRIKAGGSDKTTPIASSCTNEELSRAIVTELRSLLGDDVVLLPIKRGDKGPSGKEMEVCELLEEVKKGQAYAILHYTC